MTTKIERIRQHFLSGRSLTQLEGLGLYGAFRLAAPVHELKDKDMKIFYSLTKEEPNGSPYADPQRLFGHLDIPHSIHQRAGCEPRPC